MDKAIINEIYRGDHYVAITRRNGQYGPFIGFTPSTKEVFLEDLNKMKETFGEGYEVLQVFDKVKPSLVLGKLTKAIEELANGGKVDLVHLLENEN